MSKSVFVSFALCILCIFSSLYLRFIDFFVSTLKNSFPFYSVQLFSRLFMSLTLFSTVCILHLVDSIFVITWEPLAQETCCWNVGKFVEVYMLTNWDKFCEPLLETGNEMTQEWQTPETWKYSFEWQIAGLVSGFVAAQCHQFLYFILTKCFTVLEWVCSRQGIFVWDSYFITVIVCSLHNSSSTRRDIIF